jgi:hypothetical protein
MRHVLFATLFTVSAAAVPAPAPARAEGAVARTLPRSVFEDKVRGGWAGQMIGVSFGAPTEFRSNAKILEGPLPTWRPNRVENAIDQDDLYVEMTFAAVMDRLGLDATSEQYGDAFRTSRYNLWHANAAARRLLDRGIKAPLSGDPKYNVHANDIDFQIESDFIGLMTPGLPQAARRYSERVGRVMNYGDGLYGGIFVTSMYGAAFFESDPRKIVEAGLASLPAESGYAKILQDVLAWSTQHPDDWRRTWHLIEDKWDKDDPCPDGALEPFNIDAKLNGAYIALGLIYGHGDFARTLEVATRAGQDSDCNPSSAAGVLGVVLGYNAIPAEWKSGIAALADKKFSYTDYSFNDIVSSTIARASKVITAAGGQVTDQMVQVPVQAPVPPPLEQWDPGVPSKRVMSMDPAWQWKGAWGRPVAKKDNREGGPTVSTAGAEATLSFTGTGVIVIGRMAQDGGRADVFLDGAPAGQLEAYIPPNTNDNDLWHAFGLTAGPHTVRIVTRPDHVAQSKGTVVEIEGAVTYVSR